MTNPPSKPPRIKAIAGWKRALVQPLGWAMRLWGASLHITCSNESLRALTTKDRPLIFTLWHNRLFISAEIFRRYLTGRSLYALVSPSGDGAWLSAFFESIGVRTVRGSSHKLGREALTALIDVVRAGHDVGITPDGPRGPIYELKPGALIVARRTRSTVMLLGAVMEDAWELPSWDRFLIPRPFSRVTVVCRRIEADELQEREDAAARLQTMLNEMNPDAREHPTVV